MKKLRLREAPYEYLLNVPDCSVGFLYLHHVTKILFVTKNSRNQFLKVAGPNTVTLDSKECLKEDEPGGADGPRGRLFLGGWKVRESLKEQVGNWREKTGPI